MAPLMAMIMMFLVGLSTLPQHAVVASRDLGEFGFGGRGSYGGPAVLPGGALCPPPPYSIPSQAMQGPILPTPAPPTPPPPPSPPTPTPTPPTPPTPTPGYPTMLPTTSPPVNVAPPTNINVQAPVLPMAQQAAPVFMAPPLAQQQAAPVFVTSPAVPYPSSGGLNQQQTLPAMPQQPPPPTPYAAMGSSPAQGSVPGSVSSYP